MSDKMEMSCCLSLTYNEEENKICFNGDMFSSFLLFCLQSNSNLFGL